jgi:hypothetical protein
MYAPHEFHGTSGDIRAMLWTAGPAFLVAIARFALLGLRMRVSPAANIFRVN